MLTANPLTIGNSFGYYTGIFSTAVTASVNPTATMAALATLGAIENASIYSPDSAFFNNIADSLNAVPVLNAAASLPIANPYAAVFLTIVAAVMIVLHSFAESKMVSQATIDKLDKLTGWIGLTALSLMPLVTTESIEKTASAGKHAAAKLAFSAAASSVTVHQASSSGTPWYAWVIGIVTLIIASVVYFCCYSCVDNIGTICAAIPVKGLNIVEQIVKAIIHAGMILLQLTFPYLSFVISIILAVLGILLFRVLSRITFYYKEVYARPILHRIFRNGKEISRIHKKLPRKLKRLCKEKTLALPLFIFSGVGSMPSRSVIWYVLDGDKARLFARNKLGRYKDISVSELRSSYPQAVLLTCKRFYNLKTPDKKFNIVISLSYKDFIDTIGSSLNFPVKEALQGDNAVSDDKFAANLDN
ncbi:MAG: hypothetical protein IJ757_05700 [Clostridiales bacterium]|nr:hypothetical protein [Clostridiales bacterium]